MSESVIWILVVVVAALWYKLQTMDERLDELLSLLRDVHERGTPDFDPEEGFLEAMRSKPND